MSSKHKQLYKNFNNDKLELFISTHRLALPLSVPLSLSLLCCYYITIIFIVD